MILDKKQAQMIIDGLTKISEDLVQKSYRASYRYGELLRSTQKTVESVQQAYNEAMATLEDVIDCLRLQAYIYDEFIQD